MYHVLRNQRMADDVLKIKGTYSVFEHYVTMEMGGSFMTVDLHFIYIS